MKAAATGADEAALTDLDVGKVTSLLDEGDAGRAVGPRRDASASSMYIATNFDLTVKATAPTGPLTLTHHIELTFAQTGKDWLVTAYRVQSVRKSASSTTTTTAKGGTTP